MSDAREAALRRVIDELRQRVAEAEETLAAIRDGSVDALVVRDNDRDEIFVIGDDVASYRNFMEAMEPGAIAVDARGNILYANQRFRAIAGEDSDKLRGRPVRDVLPAPAGQVVARLMAAGETPRRPVTISLAREGADRSDLSLLVSAQPVQLGTVRGFAVTFADLTERVRAEAAERAHRVASAIIASANEAVIVCDRAGIITHANSAAEAISGRPLVGELLGEAIPLTFAENSGIFDARELVNAALDGGALRGVEGFAPLSPGARDFLISAAPLHVHDPEPAGCVLTLVDIEQRKRNERQTLLLMRELDHRVKNTLALVLSISKRTILNEDSLAGYQRAFTGRIEALAATHNLLADASWEGLSLKQVFAAEVSPFVDPDGPRCRIEGADLQLQPRAAIAVGLIFHELATNAAKHGVLSDERGRVVLSIEPRDGAPAVMLRWSEEDGPAVRTVTRKGFGHTVIARSLAYSPHGGATLDFRPEGVSCRISVPREDVA